MSEREGNRPAGPPEAPAGNGRGDGPPDGEQWPPAGVGARPATMTRREAAPRRAVATIGFLLDSARRRRGGRITLWSFVVLLAGAGIVMLAYPLITDIWADRIQNQLEQQFEATSPEEARVAFRERKHKTAAAVTKLRIPKLGVNKVVVEGITGNALRAGLGHYPDSALPGDAGGNVAIAGHRTGFGQPFRHLERMREGDKIELVTPFATFTYEVVAPFDGHANPWITHAKDWSVIQAAPYTAITLTTCDPPGTSKNRLIVRARLVGQQART